MYLFLLLCLSKIEFIVKFFFLSNINLGICLPVRTIYHDDDDYEFHEIFTTTTMSLCKQKQNFLIFSNWFMSFSEIENRNNNNITFKETA